jgi:hypothetical protein
MGVLATDNFTRADGPLTSPWGNQGFPANFRITSNICLVSSLIADDMYYNTTSGSLTNQWAAVILSAPTSAHNYSGYGPAVRVSNAAQSGYGVSGCAAGWQASKYTTGTFAAIGSGLTPTFANGDELKIEVIGSVLRYSKNGVQFFSISDTNLASGYPGVWYSETDTAGAGISSWSAGTDIWPISWVTA